MVEASVSDEFVRILRRIGEGSAAGLSAARNGPENGSHLRSGEFELGFWDNGEEPDERFLAV